MRDNPKPYEIYRHFKGNTYQILAIAKDSEDGHLIVVYQALYGSYEIYARDLVQFMSPVDRIKYPEAEAQYRFTKVEPAQPTVNAGNGRSCSQPDSKTDTGYADSQSNFQMDTGYSDSRSNSKANTVHSEGRSDVKVNAEYQSNQSDEKTNTGHQDDQSDIKVDADYQMDPQVEAFLDADSYEEKLNILAGLHRRITDDMLQIMALTMDIELNPGSTQEQYDELKNCLLTRDKFEADRRF